MTSGSGASTILDRVGAWLDAVCVKASRERGRAHGKYMADVPVCNSDKRSKLVWVEYLMKRMLDYITDRGPSAAQVAVAQ